MNRRIRVCAIVTVLVFAAGIANAQLPALGDLNGDGDINVLDIQAAIAQVLQHIPQNNLGDLDENGIVDVIDVQNLINTALGSGGLVQRVIGRLPEIAELLEGNLQAIAVSQDGQTIVVDIDTETGNFSFTLPVKNQWWIAIVQYLDDNLMEILPLNFPVEGQISTVLPLLQLSECDILNLGNLSVGPEGVITPEDLRTILAGINRGQVLLDLDGNGIPDFIDNLLTEIYVIPGLPPNQMQELPTLIELIESCLQSSLPDLTTVTLIDTNDNGIPDFIEPLLQCLRESVIPWMQENDLFYPPGFEDITTQFFVDFLEAQVPDWMDELQNPNLIDLNGNGIPDVIEPYLEDISLPEWVDGNANGIPDFLE